VAHAPHLVRLRPAPHCRTTIVGYSLKVLPSGHFLNWQQDPFGNYQARISFPDKSRELLVEVDLVVEMAVFNPFDFFLEPSAEKFPFKYEPSLAKELAPFLEKLPASPLFSKYLASVSRKEVRTIDFVVALNRKVQETVKYLIRLEPGVQSPEKTLRLGSGSCRDSAWLLVQLFRHLKLAARFVSGYLIQLAPDQKSIDGPSGPEADFTDLHAWCEVYLPGAGWIGLDPTSGLLAGEGHIPLACTPDPSGASPVTGAVDKCESKLLHEMKVTRVYESPRVTRPYTEEQWGEIDRLGRKVDGLLAKGDVRLTMGGEPTFISIDDMDGAEWNFTAMGPNKLRLADNLVRRLKAKFAPGGLLHFGQGKWYPGEVLPRWALGCYWRRDGEPVWKDQSLLAETRDYGHGESDSSRFIARLSNLLGVGEQFVMPAHEDVYYYLLRERQLPSNVDPLDSKLEDPVERERLRKVFAQGLKKVVGHVLPLRRAASGPARWASGRWFLRSERLYLIPGDSPIGLRLPLDSIPWVAPSEREAACPPDPMEPRLLLPFHEALRSRHAASQAVGEPKFQSPDGDSTAAPAMGKSAPGVVRTSLCVEPRDGRLHVFLPPVATLEDYLELVAAVEQTAGDLKCPVTIEGSGPPHDPRLNQIKVTPDPGVIEVNIHPAASWDELAANTSVLYEEARQARLAAEKFMIDGRHVGTGGGNHIVIGGSTPADSPLLRRPDLLRSLVAYWQNHPSLSFLFSSLFIGPTSQHPRVDEARNDSLYEIEVAFNQIPEKGHVPPWLVDRVFRHLLTDITGNTHRAEFCIDKLYSPDSSTGRLGLLELRAFEMPPHERMSLAQHLVLRSLLAKFWEHPYKHSLVRWGTELHDRFMLPHFVRQDFMDVLEDLNDFGLEFKPEWFAPHLEFRFPLYGEVAARGIQLEVRQALEPWHVLGEQGTQGGTSRYVDSSLERLQIKVRGMVDSRHAVLCNRRRLPLHPTGVEGEYVAGVRYRAWQPPECLHPTIGVHAPLTFDILDGWNERAVGGCVYHVAHPGGLSYSTLPVNAFEAESRRLSRFFKFGHTPGRFPAPPPSVIPEHPFTLDLRHG
jgi:uncharacterized protein (DUF2126 family)